MIRFRAAYSRHILGVRQACCKLMGNACDHTQADLLSSKEAKFVQDQIKENCVVVFSKSTCSYCRDAKGRLEKLNVPFSRIELNQRADGGTIQNVLHTMTGTRTVPRVFINGVCVGGADELRSLEKAGKLQDMAAVCSGL
ncbi:PREDICTED: glutaredoxin-like [Priapulus caudatus]|uniref:Glutaredoxin-2, mitochondrial n=1 Tax=Priapulus caudatus TaxID=37621 RepID=A0ABM1ES30_PRICU|nr:PREDICTED: glutaredoxin-like [Priapulus caudatus]